MIFNKEFSKRNPIKIGCNIIKISKKIEKTPFGPLVYEGEGLEPPKSIPTFILYQQSMSQKIKQIGLLEQFLLSGNLPVHRRQRQRRRQHHTIIRPQNFCGHIKTLVPSLNVSKHGEDPLKAFFCYLP